MGIVCDWNAWDRQLQLQEETKKAFAAVCKERTISPDYAVICVR